THYLVGNLVHRLGIVFQEHLHILPTLAEPLLAVVEPGAALANHADLDGGIQHRAGSGDSLVVHDVELCLAERWSHLVLDHLHAAANTDGFLSLFQGFDAANVHTRRTVELQRITTGGIFRTAEHH